MRLDDIVVIGLLLGVLGADALGGAPGFSPVVVLAAAAALGRLAVGRARPPESPMPAPARPALLLRARDVAGTIGAAVTGAGGHGVPVLVVDDGSQDETATAAERAGALVIRHAQPRGPGAALLTGLRLAARLGFTHAVCPAADGRDEREDLAALLAAVRGCPLAVHVLEAPHGSGGGLGPAALRLETGWAVRDAGGARAWPVGPTLALPRVGPSAALEIELLARAAWAGLPLRGVRRRARAAHVSPPLGPLLLTHALLLLERALWPPRWLRRVRAPPARMAQPGAWTRRIRLGVARALRRVRGPGLPVTCEGAGNLVRAFDGAEGAVLLTATIGDPEGIPRPPASAKPLHVLRVAGPGEPPPPPPPPGRRPLRVTPEEGYLALPALRALRGGEVLLVQGDLLVDERVVHVDLLGARRTWPAGPWLLAALAHVPVIVVAALREDGAWRVFASAPIRCVFDESRPHDAQIAEWAQIAADRLDALARRHPDQPRRTTALGAPRDHDDAGPDADAGHTRGGVAGGLAPPPHETPSDPYR